MLIGLIIKAKYCSLECQLMSSTKTHSRPKIMDPLLVPGCELIIPMKSESNFSQIQTGLFQEIFQIEDKGLNTLRTCIIINKKIFD